MTRKRPQQLHRNLERLRHARNSKRLSDAVYRMARAPVRTRADERRKQDALKWLKRIVDQRWRFMHKYINKPRFVSRGEAGQVGMPHPAFSDKPSDTGLRPVTKKGCHYES